MGQVVGYCGAVLGCFPRVLGVAGLRTLCGRLPGLEAARLVAVVIETARRDRNGNRTGPPAPPPGLHTYVLLLCHPIITCSLGSMLIWLFIPGHYEEATRAILTRELGR